MDALQTHHEVGLRDVAGNECRRTVMAQIDSQFCKSCHRTGRGGCPWKSGRGRHAGQSGGPQSDRGPSVTAARAGVISLLPAPAACLSLPNPLMRGLAAGEET